LPQSSTELLKGAWGNSSVIQRCRLIKNGNISDNCLMTNFTRLMINNEHVQDRKGKNSPSQADLHNEWENVFKTHEPKIRIDLGRARDFSKTSSEIMSCR
jgi:hypothetical protein